MKTVALLSFSLTTACATAGGAPGACESPGTVELAITAGPLLNPDDRGVPLPTEVRVYALTDASALEQVAFEDAWRGEEALGDGVSLATSLTLYPGETTSDALVPDEEAVALAAVAIVRRPEGRTWCVVVPIEVTACDGHARIALRADEYRIERTGAASPREVFP